MTERALTRAADQPPAGQCSTTMSFIGKSRGLPVTRCAPTANAAAATRQSAWLSVVPWAAKSRRQRPAASPSVSPSGAIRSPRRSLRTVASSPRRAPRHTSSMLMAHTKGGGDEARTSRSRSAAGRPRSTSMRTVVSSNRRGTAESAHAPRVGAALTPHPPRGIGVPRVPLVSQLAERAQDVVPAPLIVQGATHGLGDECASLAPTKASVELGDEAWIEVYVYSHAHSLAHNGPPAGAEKR